MWPKPLISKLFFHQYKVIQCVLGLADSTGRLVADAKTRQRVIVPDGPHHYQAVRQGGIDRFLSGTGLDEIGAGHHADPTGFCNITQGRQLTGRQDGLHARVAAGLADRCEIQVSYAIGVAEPTSIMVDTFGTGKIDDERITELVRQHFDLRPYGILNMLDLLNSEQIKYRKSAAYGHFGREHEGFSWENTDKVEMLKSAAKL